MKKQIEIKSVDYTPTNKEYNTIEVCIKYEKGRGVILFAQEWKFSKDWIFNSFEFDVFGSKKAHIILEEMKRLNRKKVDIIEEKFYNEHTDQDIVNLLK